MVTILLDKLQDYAQKKHRLSPDSGWFLPEASHPRWVESSDSLKSTALKTSTPLATHYEPESDWLERRVADLVFSALEACVVTNNGDAAQEIVGSVSLTALVLAAVYRIDEAINFADIVAERCKDLDPACEVTKTILADLPVLYGNLLVGWKNALYSWPDEIESVVDATKWGNPKTREVRIRGPARVWRAAQTLLDQAQAELRIEGKRRTPDWHLKSVLAGECIIAIREVLDRLPAQLREALAVQVHEQMSPQVQTVMGAQTLLMLDKLDYVAESLPQVVAALEDIHQGYEPVTTPELESFAENISDIRSSVLEQLGTTLIHLSPNGSKAVPDYFGQVLYTLTHWAEQAIADGDEELIGRIFPSILHATMTLHDYMLQTYRPPTYEVTPGIYNPLLDILELSGLALVYEAIRGDQSANPVRQSWHNWINASQQPEAVATRILYILDMTRASFAPVSVMRSEWGRRAAREIVKAGYACCCSVIPSVLTAKRKCPHYGECDIDAARAGKTSDTQQLTRRVYDNRAGSYLDGSERTPHQAHASGLQRGWSSRTSSR